MKKSKVVKEATEATVKTLNDFTNDGRNKPFVAFEQVSKDEFSFVGYYSSLNDFAKEKGMPANNLRPVLKGSVRAIQKHILFYLFDTEEDGENRTGYKTWIEDGGKEGEFPKKLYFEKGYIIGSSAKLPLTEIIAMAKELKMV